MFYLGSTPRDVAMSWGKFAGFDKGKTPSLNALDHLSYMLTSHIGLLLV